MQPIYNTLRWRIARSRALARDDARCSVSILGGDCSPGPLHVHHLTPVAAGGAPYDLDNLLTACSRHHPMLEALRRSLVSAMLPEPPTVCRHRHQTEEARAACEARMAKRRQRLRAAA